MQVYVSPLPFYSLTHTGLGPPGLSKLAEVMSVNNTLEVIRYAAQFMTYIHVSVCTTGIEMFAVSYIYSIFSQGQTTVDQVFAHKKIVLIFCVFCRLILTHILILHVEFFLVCNLCRYVLPARIN